MKNFFLTSISLILLLNAAMAQPKILVITGGHDFEQQEFFEMFDSFEGMNYDWLVQPEANKLLESGETGEYQAFVFYDMYQNITAAQQEAYLAALKKGAGMLFLHHSLVSYQDWPDFQQIIGGKYLLEETSIHPKSTYKHDIDFKVLIAKSGLKSPITNGIQDFMIHDEVYGNYIVNDNVIPLLITNHPESSKVIGWSNAYLNSKIVYLQPGHDHHAYENSNYRKLVRQAIEFVISE